MDPVSAWGVFTGAIQVVQVISQTIVGLSALRGRYQNADITIRSMIGELSTIKSAITQLHELAQYNAAADASHKEYEESLAVALDGCNAIMEVLSEKVAELVNANNAPGLQNDSAIFAFKARIKVLWNEEMMSGLQGRLHSQLRALNLLLQACQCRSSAEQLELLRKVESRHIIKQVADDTATLRSTIGSAATSQIDAHSITSRQLSSVGETEFEFDETLLATSPYQRQSDVILPLRQPPVTGSRTFGVQRGFSVKSSFTTSDEGYASHNPTPNHSLSPNSSLRRGDYMGPNDSVFPDHQRSKSVSFGAQPLQSVQQPQGVRRWVSTSDASSLPSPGGSKRGKFFSTIKRLSTSSRTNSMPSVPRNAAMSPTATVGSTRGRRGRESEFTTSIDLTTQAGQSAPEIIKAAQSGARYDVERLIGSGHNIEACHLHTRRNALMVAAHCGKEDIADLLIQNNANLNRTDTSGSTALHLAASRGHVDVVALLLMEAINLEAETKLGRTALWVSANHGHLQTTQLLLESGAKVNARADNQMTALHVAAQQGDIDIASLLVTYGADVDARDASMMTALHYACEGGFLNVIELLLNSKSNIDVTGSERRTPLICAAASGQLSAVQLLVRRKAKLKCLDEGGMTALHWAAFNGHVEIVSFLANQARGSLAWTNAQGRSPLHLAAMNAKFAVVEFLVRKNCSLETKCASGFDPLHYACRADSVEIVRLLLTSGSNIESQTETTQQRPIHIAAAGCSIGLIRQLCEKGASLEARDAAGDRALCVASKGGHAAAVQTLLDFGSPLHLRFSTRSHEDSPLCLAAKGGHLSVVSLLVSRGASVLSKDEMGWQPIRYAAYYGHPDVLEALIKAEPSAAMSLDNSFSPDYFGMSPDKIGFAPDSGISSDRKSRVVELLAQSQRRPVPIDSMYHSRQAPINMHSHAESVAFPLSTSYNSPLYGTTSAHKDSEPDELPGSLEQGLPSSRSATPTHMHRGNIANASHAVIQEESSSNLAPSSNSHTPLSAINLDNTISLSQQPETQFEPQILSPSALRPSAIMAGTRPLTQLESRLETQLGIGSNIQSIPPVPQLQPEHSDTQPYELDGTAIYLPPSIQERTVEVPEQTITPLPSNPDGEIKDAKHTDVDVSLRDQSIEPLD